MIGDIITVSDFKGEVISLGLMSTKIKNANGDIMILSNSSFKELINYSMCNTTIYLELEVTTDTNIEKLEKVLEGLREELFASSSNVIGYKLLGINEIVNGNMKYLVSIECKAETQYQIKRDYLKMVKLSFDKEKIEMYQKKIDINVRS